VTFGCDYAFTKANIDYRHLDIIMDEFNKQNPGVEMKYSTPAKYI